MSDNGTVTLKCESCGASVKQTKLSGTQAADLIRRFYFTTCDSGHLREPDTAEVTEVLQGLREGTP
jgi:hypothetical protein